MRMPSLWRKLAVAVVIATVWSSLAALARADLTLSVSPSLVEVAATPGGVGSLELTVSNQGSEAYPVRVGVAPYKEGTGSLSSVEWLQVEPTGFDLQPGQQRSVKVTIHVPQNADSGGRYAMVTFTTIPKTVESSRTGTSGQAGVSARIGIPILITLQGASPLRKQASITRIVPILTHEHQLAFQIVLANQGNVHVVPKGQLQLFRSDGTIIGETDLPETTSVLPGTEAEMNSSGRFDAQPGAYHARAVVDYGGTQPATNEVSFSLVADLAIESLNASTIAGKGPMLRLILLNKGELGVQPAVQLAVLAKDGNVLGVITPGPSPVLPPGQRQEIDKAFPSPLPAGEYVLVARVDYGSGEPLVQESPFRVGAATVSPANPAWAQGQGSVTRQQPTSARPHVSSGVSVAATIAVLLLLIVSLSLIRLRQRLYRAIRVLRGQE